MDLINKNAGNQDFEKEIRQLATHTSQLGKRAVGLFAIEVTNIIRANSDNCGQIEQLLDRMLDFCFDDEILVWYKKLCRYYYEINPNSTVSYIRSYKEMWDSEE